MSHGLVEHCLELLAPLGEARSRRMFGGFGPDGLRLGYGGGFYDRTLAALAPRPFTVGVGYGHGYVPWLQAQPHDVPLDAMLTEDGVAHERD